MTNFPDRLKALRKENGFTQTELAEKLNLSRSTYSGWESEGKEPDIATICFLANLFGVSCDYLLGYTDERTHANTLFVEDYSNFKKHFDNLPAEFKPLVTSIFDSIYLTLDRDMEICRSERLSLYMKLASEVQRLRAALRNRIESSGGDLMNAIVFSDIMSLQNELKNSVSSLLDELMQADMDIAFNVKNGPDEPLEKLAT